MVDDNPGADNRMNERGVTLITRDMRIRYPFVRFH